MPALSGTEIVRRFEELMHPERALRRPHWPPIKRSMTMAAIGFLVAALLVALLVELRWFDGIDRSLLNYLQHRGSTGQDIGLGVISYAGSIEVTLLVALLLAFPLFKGLRFLAIGPTVVLLAASVVEFIGKYLIDQAAPGHLFQRFPSFLPTIIRSVGANSFPSGHVMRSVIIYGLTYYLAERWELFGKDSSRLSPVLLGLVVLIGYAVLYLGWHWFADALGGLLLGLAILIGMIAYLERRRIVVPPDPAPAPIRATR